MERDVVILKEFARVTSLIAAKHKALFGLMRHIPKNDVVFCWFGTVYSAFAVMLCKIFRKRCLIVIGGVDAAKLPEIGYGIWLSRWKSFLLRHGLKRADRLLVTAPAFIDRLRHLAGYNADNAVYLPTWFDSGFWKPAGKKEPIILTVAGAGPADDRNIVLRRYKTKGLDVLISAARQMTDCRFMLIGFSENLLRALDIEIPPNMQVIGALPQTALLSYYQKAKVYCQPSRWESLVNTLCEAMLCGCVPVGADVGGIPEAIGDTGYLFPVADADALQRALRQALVTPDERSLAPRTRITSLFTFDRRRNGLIAAVNGKNM